ncbi:MAG: hypothetical protein ACT6QT_17075 [Sphingopyxis sp.]|jgi:hypothetical protein|uniref:hypothetical protein n=1 Tax=Sphingopyxis sp. TaxID=1908224 RepID=UPI003F71F660
MTWFKHEDRFPPVFTKEGTARVYEFGGQFFVCSVAHISETDSLSIFPCAVDDGSLGDALIRHLMEYSPDDRRDMREAKRSDWKAFSASGAKSVKAFEENLWHIDARLKHGNVTVGARPRLSLKDHIAVTAVARCTHLELIGAALKDTLAAAKMLQSKGLM